MWTLSLEKLGHCLEVQKAVYLRMPAEYERRVESAMACDWRKVRRHSRGSALREEWGLVLGLLLEPAAKTAPSANGTESQQLSCRYQRYGRLEL